MDCAAISFGIPVDFSGQFATRSAHALTIRRAISRFMVVLVGPVSFLAFAAVSLTGFAAWSDAGAGLAAAISLAAAAAANRFWPWPVSPGGRGLGGELVRCAAGARRARLGGGGGLVGHDVLPGGGGG